MNNNKSRDKPKAVVLLSGGMDSCVAAKIASETHRIYALHASYGQLTQEREKKAFRQVARRLDAMDTLELNLGFMVEIGESSLLDPSKPVPNGVPKPGTIPSTYVPFRNGVLLSVAVAWAESLGAKAVFIGAVAPDAPEGYPDTSPEFFNAFQKAMDIGTRPETTIKIVTPVIGMTKTEVLKKGLGLGAPLEHTWSCYKEDEVACGECLSCLGRLKAFREVGVEDKIPYKKKEDMSA